jgi:hypothetical protein
MKPRFADAAGTPTAFSEQPITDVVRAALDALDAR